MVCKRCRIKGRVQGVWFRASTQQRATSLGLSGWVRNLPGGDVEAKVWGDGNAVAQLIEWLWQGPEQARVKDVETFDDTPEPFEGFRIRD